MSPTLLHNGFSFIVRTDLYFTTVVEPRGAGVPPQYAVYVRHGSPGYGDGYRNYVPIRRFDSLTDARKLVNTLAGVVDAYRSFPEIGVPLTVTDIYDREFIYKYLCHSSESSKVLTNEQHLKAFAMGDGYGQMAEGELKYRGLTWDWSHIRDSSPAALTKIHAYLVSLGLKP